jgi:hypothetical protein
VADPKDAPLSAEQLQYMETLAEHAVFGDLAEMEQVACGQHVRMLIRELLATRAERDEARRALAELQARRQWQPAGWRDEWPEDTSNRSATHPSGARITRYGTETVWRWWRAGEERCPVERALLDMHEAAAMALSPTEAALEGARKERGDGET